MEASFAKPTFNPCSVIVDPKFTDARFTRYLFLLEITIEAMQRLIAKDVFQSYKFGTFYIIYL